jgi:hypothetical protein
VFTVAEVWDESAKIIGACPEVTRYRWLTDAVALIANKLEPEALRGYCDICTTNSGRCLSLPPEISTVLAINICGHPSLGKDVLFNFHLNGPGDGCGDKCEYSWQDQGGAHSTYRDIVEPAKLVAYLQRQEDTGSSFIVYGFDSSGNRLRHQVSGAWREGYPIPTIYGFAIPDSAMPAIARITGVLKAVTSGTVRLSTIDDSGATGTTLGIYDPLETLPQYRRIKLGRCAPWVRIAYRITNPKLQSQTDRIPLRSRTAFLLGLRALQFYNNQDLALAQQYEANAMRMEIEAQQAAESPTLAPIQVVDYNNLQDKTDVCIV